MLGPRTGALTVACAKLCMRGTYTAPAALSPAEDAPKCLCLALLQYGHAAETLGRSGKGSAVQCSA